MASFYGMRGTGDWVTDQREMNWRKAILRQYPNGDAPLTAMMSMMKSEVTTSSQFYWWTKSLPGQAGDVTGVYTDSDLSVAYVSGGTSGAFVYVQMAASVIAEIRIGHTVRLVDKSDLTMTCVGYVVDRVENGASSYVRIKLLEDDDNSSSGTLADADRIMVIGNANAEGAAMPTSISYDPDKWYNYTQIFRTPLSITGTAIEEKLRTNPQAYQEAKREILELHSIEQEKAWFFGVPSETTGANGKPLRTTLGIIPAIKGGYTGEGGTAGTVSDYITDSSHAGQSWLSGGSDWLNTQLEILFRYGKRDKLAFCGSGALLAINKLVEATGQFQFDEDTTFYGLKVKTWVTAQGTIGLIQHPLFSQEETTRYTMAVVEPENILYRPLTNRDTKFLADKSSGYTHRDGKDEEYLTEAGLEYHFPNAWGYFTGLGSDNTAS